MDPHREQRQDCHNRPSQLREHQVINKIFKENLNSVMDLRDQSSSGMSLDEETRALKSEIKKLMQAMYGAGWDKPATKGLKKKLGELIHS